MVAVLLDTKGPEIRTGVVDGYVRGEKNLYVLLEDGKKVTVTTNDELNEKVSEDMLYIDYKAIGATVKAGDRILLDDGLIGLEVRSCEECFQARTASFANASGDCFLVTE